MSECSIFRDWARINKLFWLLFILGKNLVPSLEFQTESRPESWGANPFFVLLSVASSDLSQSFPNPNCSQYLAWVSQNIRGEEAPAREKRKQKRCFVLHESSIPCPPVWQLDCLYDAGQEGPEHREVADSPCVVILDNSSHPRIFTLRLICLISKSVSRLRGTVRDSRVWQYVEYHFTLTALKSS